MPKPATREDRLAPAKGVDAGPLIGLGERIGGIGINDPPQLRLAIGGEPAIAGLLRQITGFLRVAVEIEQLRPHAGVIDVFEPPLADHKGAGRRAGGMVFRQHRPPRRNTARDIEQREDNGFARGLRGRAVHHIREAVKFSREAIEDRRR